MDEPTPTPPDAPLCCGKCGGAMVQGFVVDKTHGGNAVSQWAAGPPQRSFWTGVKTPDDALPLGAFRCSNCGYVEFYAGDVFRLR